MIIYMWVWASNIILGVFGPLADISSHNIKLQGRGNYSEVRGRDSWSPDFAEIYPQPPPLIVQKKTQHRTAESNVLIHN